MQILNYRIQTCMGEISPFYQQLNFLTDDELEELNKIGYTGKNSKGERTRRVDYLNSLNKGTFSVEQTKFDSGDFTESFNITRVVL